jgi:hypothetical protein
VPSELAYVPAADDFELVNPRSADAHDILWGLQLKPDQPRLRCLKLKLDPRQKLPHYISEQDLNDQLLQYGKTTEDAISDYLSLIYKHAMDALVKRFGAQMVSSTPIQVVLTVPAVWTDAAKDATFRVATKAGMGPNLHMISEPEAAAIYSLKSMDTSRTITHGDNFIICDAGGGTVDLISYEVKSLEPLQLEESAPGTGALCGGVMLNLRFQALVKSRMGSAAFKELRDRKPKSWAIALKYFEDYVKKNFDPANSQVNYDDSKFNVPLPGAADDLAAGIDCGFFTLSTAEVAELFRPLVDSVIELVERQRNILLASGRIAKGVIIVGGFGQSNYLFKCLKSRFADEDPPPSYTQTATTNPQESVSRFVVLQPVNAWTAVVRGAVLSSIQNKVVQSRKARSHYGISHASQFDMRKHSVCNKYWDIYDECYKARNQLSWHVKRGDDLPIGRPVLLSFKNCWNINDTVPEHESVSIIVSDAAVAPYEHDHGSQTRTLCTLRVNLANVPRKQFKQHTNSAGIRYRSLDYEVGLHVRSGQMVFDLRVGGVVQGFVKADFQ